MHQNYIDCIDFLSSQFDEINGYEFYRRLFPNNQTSGVKRALPDGRYQANAIFLYPNEDPKSKRSMNQRIMLADTWEDDYVDFIEETENLTLCSGCTYRGRYNRTNNAREMNALILDIDGVGDFEIRAMFHLFNKKAGELFACPLPTYIVASGSGVHLYYVFENPVSLYPNIKKEMKILKDALLNIIWVYGSTSQIEDTQYQGIIQGFRMVGSINAQYGTVVRAFETGSTVTLEELNSYVIKTDRATINPTYEKTRYSREEMKIINPEWYQDVVIDGMKKTKEWKLPKGHKGDELYNWWLRYLHDNEIKGGRRYNYMMILAALARKGTVTRKQLKKDLVEVFEALKIREWKNELTEKDVLTALKAYDKNNIKVSKDKIKDKTGIVVIPKIPRRGRKQSEHLKRARAVQEIDYPDGSWREGNGRPSASAAVKKYQKENPEARKIDCHRDTGLSRPTIQKWWNIQDEKTRAGI